MNAKLIIASLAGGVLMFFLGWLVYGVLLMSFYEANTTHYEGLMKEMPNMYLMVLSNLLMGFLLAFMFQRWAGFKTLSAGLTGGLIFGFLIALIYDLYFLACMNLFPLKLMIVDVIVSTVITCITGALIGWILGFEKKKTPEAV